MITGEKRIPGASQGRSAAARGGVAQNRSSDLCVTDPSDKSPEQNFQRPISLSGIPLREMEVLLWYSKEQRLLAEN